MQLSKVPLVSPQVAYSVIQLSSLDVPPFPDVSTTYLDFRPDKNLAKRKDHSTSPIEPLVFLNTSTVSPAASSLPVWIRGVFQALYVDKEWRTAGLVSTRKENFGFVSNKSLERIRSIGGVVHNRTSMWVNDITINDVEVYGTSEWTVWLRWLLRRLYIVFGKWGRCQCMVGRQWDWSVRSVRTVCVVGETAGVAWRIVTFQGYQEQQVIWTDFEWKTVFLIHLRGTEEQYGSDIGN